MVLGDGWMRGGATDMTAAGEAVDILYGKTGMQIRLPQGARATVIGKRPLAKLSDPKAAVRDALAHPVEAPAYSSVVRGRKSACILICDITRPVPNHLFLRPLIEGMLAAGMPREGITVLVATGLHRPNEGAELAEVVGDPWVLDTVKVENHFARDAAAHVDLGVTSGRRTPVKLDRRFVEAEVRIATGLVEPHFMAGYSGGERSSRRASRTRTPSARFTARASWRTRRRSSATSPATRCTRSSSRSCGCWATSTPSTR